eukprot:537500-Amphidinium_carterae.1
MTHSTRLYKNGALRDDAAASVLRHGTGTLLTIHCLDFLTLLRYDRTFSVIHRQVPGEPPQKH